MYTDENKPNILFIMTDQHRFDYLTCAGANFVKTPNIDRIARKGMRFTNCFTNAPVCVPARIGLACGLQPARVGALDNFSYLPLNIPTFYQHFRNHGYRMGCVGKLDLAKPSSYNGRYGDRPCVYGWGFTHPEEVEGKLHSGRSPLPRGPYGFYLKERGQYEKFHESYKAKGGKSKSYGEWGSSMGLSDDSVLPTEDFQDTYIGKRACEWIDNISDDFPWHLFVSFAGPHDPYDPPVEYAERYRNAEVPDPIPAPAEGKPQWITKKQNQLDIDKVKHTRRQYCAAIELIDDQIGNILDSLQKRGMMENTYIVFCSDHGDMLGDLGLYQKSVPYEASIHVPLIIAGPGIPEGEISDAMVELIDLNPTVSDLAGLPHQQNMDAQSLYDILKQKKQEHREDIVTRLESFRCIRTKKYKFINNINDKSELYDLENDPCELNNIIDDNPEIARTLYMRILQRYMEGKWLY